MTGSASKPHSELRDLAQELTRPGVVTHGAEGELARGVLDLFEQFDTAVAALEHIGHPNYSARPTGRDALDMAGAARTALSRIRGEES